VHRENIGGRESETDIVRGDLFREPVNGVKLRHSLPVGAVIPFRSQRALADINDHERHVHIAFDHFRQIDLRRQAHFVIAVCREVGGLDVVVGVELDHPVVNAFGFGNQRRIVRLRRAVPGSDLKKQTQCGKGSDAGDDGLPL